MEKELAEFDLNLLRSLDALLKLKHVSRAAEYLNITQSGMSKNLSRLRVGFQDELLVRVGNQMILTPKAEALLIPLDSVLLSIHSMLAEDEFDPSTTPMQFTLAATDFLMQLYFPRFLESLLTSAPFIKINLVTWSAQTLTQLANGQVDFLMGGLDKVPPGIYRAILDSAGYVCLTRKKHNLFGRRFDLEAYLKAKHVSISLMGTGSNPIDDWLQKQGLKRNVVVTTPNFMSAIAMVSESDLVMVAHAGIAKLAQRYYDFDVHPLPVAPEMPPFGILWHERTHRSPAHRWFRQQIIESVELFE